MFIPKIPDNDLKPYIEELVYIVERFYAETDEEDRFGMQFKFNAPATDEEINYLETSLNIVACNSVINCFFCTAYVTADYGDSACVGFEVY